MRKNKRLGNADIQTSNQPCGVWVAALPVFLGVKYSLPSLNCRVLTSELEVLAPSWGRCEF